MKRLLFLLFLASVVVISSSATNGQVEGFDGGSNGGFIGNFVFESTGGNPDGNARINFGGPFFFPSLRTGGIDEPVNEIFLGDFSGFEQVEFSFDVRVDLLQSFAGNEIVRPFGIMLIDRDVMGPNGPSGIFFETEFWSSTNQDDWTTCAVNIEDPTVDALPPGWIGFGDEDPSTFEPILPPGATFATVLSSVDEFRLTGAVPGFFFNNAFFDARIDNVRVSAKASCLPGDVNQDQTIDLLDVAPFVNLISTGRFQCEADINQDGEVDLLDVGPFVRLISG